MDTDAAVESAVKEVAATVDITSSSIISDDVSPETTNRTSDSAASNAVSDNITSQNTITGIPPGTVISGLPPGAVITSVTPGAIIPGNPVAGVLSTVTAPSGAQTAYIITTDGKNTVATPVPVIHEETTSPLTQKNVISQSRKELSNLVQKENKPRRDYGKKVGPGKYHWSSFEDALLVNFVKSAGGKEYVHWTDASKHVSEASSSDRSASACRNRYKVIAFKQYVKSPAFGTSATKTFKGYNEDIDLDYYDEEPAPQPPRIPEVEIPAYNVNARTVYVQTDLSFGPKDNVVWVSRNKDQEIADPNESKPLLRSLLKS